MIQPLVIDKFIMIDVESVGLHGEGFAVGWVLYDLTQKDGVYDMGGGILVSDMGFAVGNDSDRAWVTEHVLPALLKVPGLGYPFQVRDSFKPILQKAIDDGYKVFADCVYPVETNFLAHMKMSVYPLYDLASFLAAKGIDPLQYFPRLEDEKPIHNPLADARQSARILSQLLDGSLSL